MEQLTVDEIELCLTAFSMWESEYWLPGDDTREEDAVREKLERMKKYLEEQNNA